MDPHHPGPAALAVGSFLLLCAEVMGATALAMVPAAEAKNHYKHHHNQHALKQLRRDIRHGRPAGFGIQLRF